MLKTDSEEIHREYTTRFVADVMCGTGTMKAEDCPCDDCRRIKKANHSLIHRALASSAAMTYQQMGPYKPTHISGCYCPTCTEAEVAAHAAQAQHRPFNPFSVNEESYRWKR